MLKHKIVQIQETIGNIGLNLTWDVVFIPVVDP